MLNRIFFISELASSFNGQLPLSDQVFYSLLIDPSTKGELDQAYEKIASMPEVSLGLAIRINTLPDAQAVRSITSFLFLPGYPCMQDQPVLNLIGNETNLLNQTSSLLKNYFSSQGIDHPIVFELLWPETNAGTAEYFIVNEADKAIACQKSIFASHLFYNKNIFCHATSASEVQSVTDAMQQAENEFQQRSPGLFALATEKISLEKTLVHQNRKNLLTELEMNNQKQYVDILRSSHSTRELQDYYNDQYEVLPAWYKRLGHLVKVVMGKRSFRSLFRNDVKKTNH